MARILPGTQIYHAQDVVHLAGPANAGEVHCLLHLAIISCSSRQRKRESQRER